MELLSGLVLGSAAGVAVTLLYKRIERAKFSAIRKREAIQDPANQIRFVEEVDFEPRRPINREAFSIYSAIEKHLEGQPRKWRLLAEIGMGAFLKTSPGQASKKQQDRAFSSINSKRVDFLIIDPWGSPAVAVEYQGSGHHLSGDAAQRDSVKKRALEKSGVELVEVRTYNDPQEYLGQIDAALKRHEQARSARR